MAGMGRRGVAKADAWPVWVDALSNLLIVVIFVLMVFVVAQAYLATSLTGRDQALTRLNRQLAELGELLAMEREANADLRVNIGQLSAELQSSTLERDRLAAGLTEARGQRDTLEARLSQLTGRADRNAGDLAQAGQQLEDAYKVIEADRGKIEVQLRQLASLEADIRQLREVRSQLEGQIAALTLLADQNRAAREQAERAREQAEAGRAQSDAARTQAETARTQADTAREQAEKAREQAEQASTQAGEELRLTREDRERLLAQLGTLRDRSQALEARLATEAEKTMLAQKEVEDRGVQIAQLEESLTGEKALSTEGRQQVELLNQQIAELRRQLTTITAALDASEVKGRDQQVQIADLGRRLNLALATKVEELSRYRSEFFGRLREALGSRPDIRIVGDRFVFQSEVLFNTGSATLEERGRVELGKLATTLIEIAGRIPGDVNWVLRVDGHTDPRPISTPQFPSNWELSTARAIAVVRFLREQGIPAERLAAAGFGEFQPLEPGASEAAYARNRRIEIKFDQR